MKGERGKGEHSGRGADAGETERRQVTRVFLLSTYFLPESSSNTTCSERRELDAVNTDESVQLKVINEVVTVIKSVWIYLRNAQQKHHGFSTEQRTETWLL